MQGNNRAPGASPVSANPNQAPRRGPLNPSYVGRALELFEPANEEAGPQGGYPVAAPVAAAPAQRNFVALVQAPRPAHPIFAAMRALHRLPLALPGAPAPDRG